MTAPTARGRAATISVIARREGMAATRGFAGYVALSIALVAAIWMLLIDVRALEAGGILVLANPFAPALSIAMLVIALFLAVSAAASTARDRENGTLEVLFYGPVDEITYVLGKLGGLMLAYIAALPLVAASFAGLAWMTGFALTLPVLASLALSIIPATEIVGFGILLAIGTDRVRTALLLLVSVIAALIGVTVAYSMVQLVPITDPGSSVLPLRDALAALDAVVRWISPFAYLERAVEGAASGRWRSALGSLAASVAWTVVMIALAAFWLRRRGVVRRGD